MDLVLVKRVSARSVFVGVSVSASSQSSGLTGKPDRLQVVLQEGGVSTGAFRCVIKKKRKSVFYCKPYWILFKLGRMNKLYNTELVLTK